MPPGQGPWRGAVGCPCGQGEAGGLVGIDFPVYEGGGRDAGDWTDVAVWSPEEALVMIDAAGVEPVALHASPGSFSFAEVGENHHRYQWMVKP